jgi:hypothetical protein
LIRKAVWNDAHVMLGGWDAGAKLDRKGRRAGVDSDTVSPGLANANGRVDR